MPYNFTQDYTIEERKATLDVRTIVRNKVDGSTFTQVQLDALKNLTLDLIHQLIDEPQLSADDREYSLSINTTDRSKQINISNNTSMETRPAYFSDGKRIAFERDGAVWGMDKDGSNKIELISNATSPHVSPQGDYIVFLRPAASTGNNIFFHDLTTGITTQVTNTTTVTYDMPKVSPTGGIIAFNSNEFGRQQVFTVNIDGTGIFRVVNRDSDDVGPSWSQEESLIFSGPGVGGTVSQLWTVNADGTGLTKLTNTTTNESYPVYSYNNKRIAFVTDRYTTTTEIVTMKVDGTDLMRLTENSAEDDRFPQYSYDGVHIVAVRGSQIYTMPTDGVPVYPEYRHEYLMRNNADYHSAWAYEHASRWKEYVDASSTLYSNMLRGRRDWTYREYDPDIVDRSLLRHGYREAREGELPPPEVVGKRAPAPGTA